MDELERAILCGIDPNETNEAKARAAHLCEQFNNTPEPWKYSIQKLFTTDNIAVKFFCLNTCQIFLQQRFVSFFISFDFFIIVLILIYLLEKLN